MEDSYIGRFESTLADAIELSSREKPNPPYSS
jgi:hypothetical protein